MPMCIHELVDAVAEDSGVLLPTMEDLQGVRSSWLDSALTDPYFSVSPNALRAYEIMSKVRDLEGKPESSLPDYLASQAHPVISADDIILDDMAQCWSYLAGDVLLSEVGANMRHGPGAVTDGLRSYDKWLTPLSFGELADAADPLLRLKRDFPIETNRYCEVPKTSWKNRGICVESTRSQLEQQGIGVTLRKHLILRGFDLSNQWRQNITLSRQKDSITLDLSSASDLVSKHLMRLICVSRTSKRWLLLMENARSKFTHVPDGLVEAESFASMGNGFCFVNLTMVCMSVVFAAIRMMRPELRSGNPRRTMSIYRDTTSVFGDDIVVTRDLAPYVSYVLSACGLRVNYKKSSFGGNLKETCGSYVVTEGLASKFVYAIPRIKYLDPTMRNLESMISFCATQRALFDRGWVSTAGYMARYVGALYPREVMLIESTPGVVTSESSFASGSIDPFGAFLVCKTENHVGSAFSRASVRWSASLQRRFVRASTFRERARAVYLGDSVGYASTLFGDSLQKVALEENLGNVPVLRSGNVYI